MKPYSESCDQNCLPILEVLRSESGNVRSVLEIGSGTGQHAVFFTQQFPDITWQTSDVAEYHAGIQAWIDDSEQDRCLPPLTLDVVTSDWPADQYDMVFSANTCHIMSWIAVQHLFAGIGKVLNQGGRFCLYGPFNKSGDYTSDSNARFDQWLKQRDPDSGIRHQEDLQQLATENGLLFQREYAMPTNNLILVWQKD